MKEIIILNGSFCSDPKCNNNSHLLETFSKLDTSNFCLAHLFTLRDFPGGVAGYGYTGSVCDKSHNTALTTFLNHKVTTIIWHKSN